MPEASLVTAPLHAPAVRTSLRTKLMALCALLVVVPLCVVGYLLVDVNRDAVEQLEREKQVTALGDLTRTIDERLGGAEDALESVGRALSDPELPEPARLSAALAVIGGAREIDTARVYAADGEGLSTIMEVDREATREPPANLSEEIRAEIERWGSTSGSAVEGPAVLVAVRIRAGDRTTGYVASYVSLDEVQHRLERIAVTALHNQPNSLYVVDQELRLLAHTDAERASTLESAREEGALAGVDPRELGADLAFSGEFEASDGVPMLGSRIGLEGRPWALVAQVPQDVAYATLVQMYWRIGVTVLVAILLALLVAMLFSGALTRDLRALVGFAKKLSAREFGARAAVESSDEVGVLAFTMERAAVDLEASEARIREEIAIRTDLGRYVSSDLVDAIVRREKDMRLGGTRRAITVLFADVVNFTPLAQKLAPEEVVTILNELFTILTGIVFKHGGTIDKFIGDSVMAIYNAPSEQPDHAELALSTAEDMLSYLEAGAQTWRDRYNVDVQLAIGVHTGECVVGNIGSESRMEYTAIGDVVNVAARLEAIARPGQILTTAATRDAAGDMFDYGDAGEHPLSGRTEPIQLYEVRS